MAGDKFDQLYNALKADGAVSGTREHFRQFVYAPGKQGYHNRKQLYDALYADGAVSSKSYEEFAQRLGLHAVNPKPQQQKPVQLVKKQTMKQRAQEVAAQYQNGKQTKPPVDYLHRPQSQMGRARRNAPGKASPFVQSLYEIDNAQKGPDYSVDYTSPKATQQVYQQNQQLRRQAAKTAGEHIVNDEYRRQSQPMIDNGSVGVMKPMGEIEQEMSDSASRFVDANLGDYINNAVLGEQNAAGKRAVDAYNNSFAAGGGGGGGINDLLMRSLAYNEENDPDKMIENLAKNARSGLEKLFQNPSFVAKVKNEADMLGVTPDAYVESMLPHLKDRLSAALEKSEYNKYLPKDAFENMTNRFIDSNTIGKLVRGTTMTRGQRIMQERASAATAAGENPYYKGSTIENVVADVAGMVSDPVFKGAAGAGGKVAGKLIGNSTKLAALMANGNLAQRLMAKGAQAVTSGGVTGFVFDSTGSVIQNYSTGEDTSLGNTLKVAAKGGTTGAVNFATMSLAGIPLSEVGRSIGLKAVKGGSFWGNTGRATAKIGLESGKIYMEAMGMYLGGYVSGKLEGRTDANGKPIEFDLWNGTMESLPTAIGFRLQHAIGGLKGGRKNEKGEDMGWFGSTIANFKDFVTSDKAKESRFLMTEDERNQIFSSGAMNGLMPDGENIVSYAKRTKNKKVSYEDPYLETDASMIKNTYDQIMADPKVSWDAKAKFSAMVTGIMPSARPMMDYITFSSEDYVKDGLLRGKRKYVNEYSAKGELLSKIPYDNKVDRDNVVYKHNIVRENQRLYNAMGLLARQDRNNYELQNDFFVENMKKPGADVNSLVTNMGNEGSDVFRDFSLFALNSEKGTVLKTIDSVAVRNGMKSEDLIKAMKKNPMKRTDFEQNVCVELRRALESKAFPYGKVHVEQSNLNGKDVAEDNNLGTEQPNGDAVKQELNGLRQAEEEVEVLMRDNDVFSQNFKKLQSQGLTNPQIYDWMVQQGGLTVEQLEPFAHYINANARVQGMQEATKQKIEETVSVFAQDWSYHGTLNGKAMNGEQALYVQDSNGRTLLVGSGDVAFDQTTGRAKEGSGDMLVCFDPNTKEMVYVKADEVTFFQNQPIDQFAAEYRQRLQIKNSEPYNQAAQEQAMQDAAKPQQEQEAPQDNTTKSEDSTTKSGENGKDDTTSDTTSGKDNTTNEDLVPQEQPQPSRKFADGSDVPMTTDRKGRPTPDYASMTPEQSAEILTDDFGENAEKVVDGQIQKAEKALKDAEKMKVDYTAEPNDIMEQEALKNQTIEAAKKQLDHAKNIKKAMTAKKVAETVGKTEQTEGAHEAGSVAAQKFVNAPRLVGNKRTRMLADGETKIRGHYEIVPAESLTPSHDVNNGYKKSEGFPTDAEGRTVNDRDYEHDKAAQQNTDQIARKYNGMAIEQVPVVSDEGIVYDGNGRTMAGQKAAKEGTDGEYINDLLENAENFGFTREQIEKSGIEHPRLVLVTDERLPYDAATFAKFNRNEKKTQSNTEQAVAKAKTLTSDEVGAIVAEIEGNGSLDAFFNNSKAINDLVKTLVDKGIIGQNEVAQMMDSPERLSAQGREYVKNLLLGSIFKPETIRMLGIDSTVKNKAINAIRSVMDNMKLGDYSLRDEIDQAIQLLYEARQGGNKVDTLLRTPDMFGEDAAKRYSSISQMMALALEGKVADFRDLLDEYNRIAASRNTGEGSIFEATPTKEELINEYLNFKKWKDYGTGYSETEGGNDVSGVEKPQQEASGGNEPAEAGEGRVKSDLDRITETDEEFDVEGKYGTIYKKKYLIDGDKEVMKVDEPNKDGDYTGSYYEFDGKKYGDLTGVLERIDGNAKAEEMPEGPIYDRKKALIEEIERGGIKKKDDAFQLLYKAEDLLDDYYGIPHDEWRQEPSRSNTINGILSMARNMLDRIENEPVEPASERQLAFLESLTKDDPTTREQLEGVELNKRQASWLIGRIKGLDDNLMRLHPDDIAEAEKEIHDGIEYMKKMNGETSDEGGLPLLPKEEKPEPQFNPIEAAAAEFKKEHPLTEDEIMNADVDDLSKDMALDYLNGEVTDDLHRAIYESIYAKRKGLKVEPKVEKVSDDGIIHNDDVQNHDWSQYKEGDIFDYNGFKVRFKFVERDENGNVTGVAVQHLDENGKPIENGGESVPPLMFMQGYTKDTPKVKREAKNKVKTADDAAVAASNKKVNDLWDMLKNAGKDEISASFIGLNSKQLEVLPKLVSAMAENAYLRIKRGMHNLEDVVKEMRKEFAPAAKVFKKEDVDAIYEQMMNIRYRDGEQRMSLKDWADYYEKTSPKHQENLVGDSKSAEERKMSEKKFMDRVNTRLGFGQKINGIVELRKMAEECGLKDSKDTDLQELAEAAIVMRARGIASSESTNNAKKFELIKRLYENQPSLNQRDSERVMKQQYSTPAPYAFLADMYVKGKGKVIDSALEPSAGNGMLTIGLPMDKVHVNDIDAQRLANLRRQGFKNVTSQDGTQPFADKDVDVVVTNPPFGSATPKEYDGYKISSLEGQMAINALESMKDDGRAAIIIGGKTEYAKNGSLNPKDKAFPGYLYSHYNVEDVINVDGSLYAKQGTSYPTRIILINGRRNYDPEHKVFPPVEKDARAEAVKDYDELYKRIEDDILRKRGVQKEPLGLSNRERVSDVSGDSLRQKERGGNGVTNNKEHGSGPDGFISDLGTGGSDERPMGETERTPSEHMGDNAELESGRDSDFGADRGTGSASPRLDNGGRVPEGSVARNANETSNERGAGGDRKQQGGQGRSSSSVQRTVPPREGNGLGVKKEESPKRELSTEKVKYVPQSNNPFSLNSVIPADQARATKKALEKIGDVDSFLVDELGYNDADDMHHALASEQADSVALAIHQAKQGNAFIIGDMTGIGKGRQAAAMIRFAYKQGKIPVFITAKKALFSDMYRDLKSIGNSDLRPFIWAAKDKEHSADMTDSEGKLVYQLPSDKEQERVMDYLQKNGKLPDGYDYIVTTYDSFSSGTMDYEDGKKTVRKNGKGSKNGQRKRDVLEAIAKNANVIMDESHKAGGQGSGSAYLQYVVPKLNAITFLSATYAKRPDNMPIYALRTSMNQAGMKPSELIDAIKRGGATLQEVMSQALTASGQFIRRERDMTGVTIDWKTIDDPVVVEEQREQYDSIIGLFNDIINFQRTYVGAYLDKRNDELAAIQATIKNRQGTKDLGIHNQPFASRTYNMVQQVLLSLKAREAAKSAIEHLKNGEKVVIALNNTNESQTEQYEANAEMEAPDLGVVLMKGLQGVLRYDQTDDMGNKTFGTFNIEDLGPDAVARYHEIEDNIKNASTGLSLSPIDVVRDELEAAGYRVGELTGRKTMFVKNPNGTVSKVKRTDTDKKKLALDFNTNKIDALILNRSASTGISLHDSVEYDVEHKPRTMIVVQQQPDVNEEVQMRGRIDRTGQVNRGRYEYIVSQIPSEQRLLMMFKAKLKSLDANTTSSQKSKFNDMEVSDIINKYGDKVVREYMAEHLDLYSRMADPFGWESSFGEDLSTIDPQRLIVTSGGKLGGKEAGADASKLLGRMALLRVSEQEKMLQEIGELYANEIQRLNEMGENDLEITELPLKAKTIRKEVWKQGAEPGGDNAFADNTYIEKVNMAILKKPMKASEVKASQEGLTGGKTWEEYKTEKKAAVKEYFDQKIADETQRYEERAVKVATKAKEKYIKDAKKGQKDSGMSDEQIEKMAGYQYDNIYKQEKDKLNDVVKNLKAKAEMFDRVLDTFDTNSAFVLPADMNNPNELSGFGNSYGRLIDIKITDNFSPNASSVSFATLDGRRKITFPIAGKVGSGENKADVISAIDNMTKQAAGMGDSHLRVLNQKFDNWDRLTSNESRKNGYIVTGNLMQAWVDSKDQGLGGQLVKYTTDTGEVKTGILMPDRFDPKGLTTDAPINSVTEKFELSSWHGGIDEVTSSDGEVKVKRIDNNRGNYYELRVPKSKAKGGKYFLDKDLLKLVNGNNFETRGNNMLAEFKPDQLKPVLDRLSKMGVKVQEERKTSEDEGTHFREDRGLQYYKTDTKDVKNSRIIPEDVDKNVSSQIEKRFDDEVERLYGDSSEKPNIEKEANKYAEIQYIDTFKYDEKGNPVKKYEGLNSIINSLDSKLKDIEQKYGFNRKSDINEIKSAIGTETAEGNDSRGTDEVSQWVSVRISSGKGVLSDYQKTALSLAAAQRAKEYLFERFNNIRLKYGLEEGDWASKEQVERIFNDYNSDADVKKIFDRIVGIVDVLGTKLKSEAYTKVNVEGYYYHPKNYILIDTDYLSSIQFGKQELASTICHEMLHVATSDIINLYRKGYGDLLNDNQRKAAKEVVDLYDKINSYYKRHFEGAKPYALTNPAEMITELANPTWRRIAAQIPFAKGWFRRIVAAVRKMLGFPPKVSALDRLDKALENVIRNLDYGVFQKGAELNDEIVNKKVTDPEELDRLNKEKTFRMYSGMQEVDGKLYSPMAAIIDGKRTDATEIGAWMGADERPDLVKNGKFTLVKTDKNKGVGEGDVPAAYNPYMHTSTSMMNDQFTGAYARGNIKVVEWEIPESEKTSGYHAEGAKDAVGLVPWHSGSVNSLLPKDRQRQVMLSRWRKAVRVVPDSEVAESIAEQLKGTGLAIPWNVVTPNQVSELAKLGVPITTVESGRQAPETKEKFLKQMVELEQEFPQAKFVNVKMTKDAYKEWGKDGGTKFRTDNGESNYPTSSVESYVEKVAQKTGGKVKMVSSVDEITNKAAKAAIEEGRKITGWYDEKTGEVRLYMPNIHDRYTAEKTIWHEVVGHKGMRELFGDERFDKFLRDVWYDLDKPENAALKKLVDEERKFNPLNIYDAIEEGIARLAEDGKGEPGFWNGIKNKVSDFLHEIGYRIAPNTKDVKYLLWLSKNLQKNPNDPYWKMRAEAVKYRLDHERMPAVVAHDGMFYGNEGKVRSLESLTKSEWDEATDGQIHFRTTPSAGTALDRYHRSLDEHGYMLTESYMDNMLSLKKLMNAIVPDKKIEDIASSENPYMLQNTMQGAMSDAAQMFERNVMKPLDKAMADVLDAFDGKKDDEKIRNFNLYMITKHGLERNRVFFVRDFLRQMRMDEQKKQDADFLENSYYSDKEYLDNELKAGNIDLKEYYRQLDESIRNHFDAEFEAGEHDYSGIHAIQEVAKSSDPYDDAEAIQSVMDSEAKMESIKKGAVKDYWDKVKAATQYSIDSDYKNNIIDKESHDYVSNMFNWYVPLRKYDEATAEDTYGYITEQGDPKSYIGSTIMRARGHKYLSETNVLAQIGAMGNRAIKNGGLNAIKMAFARFARNNSNNNLITEVSVWYEKDPMTGIVYERYPEIPEDATPDEINQIVSDFNTDMKAKSAQDLASKVYRRGSIGYKFQRAENKSQHIVDVKIAGRTHSFIINGNPRAAQALNGLLEHKNDTLAGRVAASISRNMAQLCTSYNPEFVMRNMIKDFEYASINLLAKEGFRYTKLFEQYYAKVGIIDGIRNSKLKDLAYTGGFGLFAKYRNGTLDTNDKVQRYFKEFMENGGETGWVQIKNMKDWTKEYKLHIKGERKKVQKVGKGIYNAIFKNLENVNEIAENLARFATYCASRDSNRSIIRSVYDAKVVSTNFNRHGSGNAIYSFKNGEMGTGKTARKNIYGFTAAWFRNSSMFFNAGIQSTNLLIKNFKNNKSGTIGYIASAPFISGMAMALLNNFIISNEDEKDRKGVKDPYAELPDYIRRNNLCIYIGGGEFVTIPLAIEERAFYGLGDFAAGMTFSKNISSQKMPNLTENKDIDKYLNPFMDAVGCMSQLVPVADYLGNASFGKHPVQETIKAVVPSATSPFLEWMYNSDWKGAPIQRDNKFDENQPSWMLAYKGTPEWMINMNKKVNALTNDVAPGNEDMKGNDFLDEVTNPSALHHFYGSYLGGAVTFVERVAGLIKNGKNTETKDIPFVRSLLYTPSEQSSLQRTKSKWYNYKDEMEKTMANVDRLKSKNVPLDKRITNIGEYYQFQNSKEAAKVRVIELAEKQMKRWKKLRDKSSDTESINFANQNIDRIMMDAVDELDRLE